MTLLNGVKNMKIKSYQDILKNAPSMVKTSFLIDWLIFTENVFDSKEKARLKDSILNPLPKNMISEEVWVGKYTYALSIDSKAKYVKIFNPNNGGWQRLEFLYPEDATHIFFKIRHGGNWDTHIPLLLKINDRSCSIWCDDINGWYELKSGYRFSNDLFALNKCYESPLQLGVYKSGVRYD